METLLERIFEKSILWLQEHAITLARIVLGIIFFWFGILKFFPGLSPAEAIAGETIELISFGLIPPSVSLPLLAAWETLIGIGFITGRFPRLTVLIMLAQMAGTMSPLVVLPEATYTRFPYALTLEGQYIVKNLALIGIALIVWAAGSRGRVVPGED